MRFWGYLFILILRFWDLFGEEWLCDGICGDFVWIGEGIFIGIYFGGNVVDLALEWGLSEFGCRNEKEDFEEFLGVERELV